MENAYKLSEKIITDINTYSEKHISKEGKSINTEESLQLLNQILEEGLTLYKYLIEKELFKDKPSIEGSLNGMQKYYNKLVINEDNAKKLTLSNAMQLWEQLRVSIAFLACTVLDYRDTLN